MAERRKGENPRLSAGAFYVMNIICYDDQCCSKHNIATKKSRTVRRIKVLVDGLYLAHIEEKTDYYSDGCYSITVRESIDGRFEYFKRVRSVAEAQRLIRERFESAPPGKIPVAELPAAPDAEFYPTPSSLAGKMIAGIDWKCVYSVLEPSAGKGDLLHALDSYAKRYRTPLERRGFSVRKNCDTIERDTNLQFILRGKGFRVIADDFLSYDALKRYDVILMNPPFSEGDKHLMKALMLQENGGQICCLLNAETIRNPYTKLRQKLVQMLMERNARIEFIKDAFKHAERPSDVEVAIVTVNIPQARKASSILEGLKRAQEQASQHTEPKAITHSDWIHAMIDNYQFEIRAGNTLIEEYMAIVPYIMVGSDNFKEPTIQLSAGGEKYSQGRENGLLNAYIHRVRLKYWHEFMYHERLSEVVGAMPSAMLEEYQNKAESMAEYDFDEYNVRQCILDMQLQLSKGMDDAILVLFDKLSAEHAYYPECTKNRWYYDGWKTNKAHKIGKKCIIPANGCFAESWHPELLSTYRCYSLLSDLEKVLNYLDRGQTTFHCNLDMELRRANAVKKAKVDTTYFEATFYKKGTCHIKFHSDAQHIIDRLNIFAGLHRNWLPPYYGKVKYDDMDAEGRAVIDSYQGAADYEKVVASPAEYLPAAQSILKLA